jgi:Lhr-like helicase
MTAQPIILWKSLIVLKVSYEDWEFSIRAAANGKINKIEKTIFFYRVQKVSRNNSANKISTNLFETIIVNNQQIYLSNMSEVLMLFRNDNDKLRKGLKTQKKIKKLLIFSVVLMGLLLVAFKI